LAERGRPVSVYFGPDESDLLASWRREWSDERSWTPVQEDLMTTAACLQRLDAVVTNDTGLMHMAAGAGTPVVALFGPTVEGFGFRPVGKGHRIVQNRGLQCRPCTLHGGSRCPKGHFRCMLDLDAAAVLAAVEAARQETLSSPAPLPRL
jgi:heptosyltransferase-2